jgi:hypothetical protein
MVAGAKGAPLDRPFRLSERIVPLARSGRRRVVDRRVLEQAGGIVGLRRWSVASAWLGAARQGRLALIGPGHDGRDPQRSSNERRPPARHIGAMVYLQLPSVTRRGRKELQRLNEVIRNMKKPGLDGRHRDKDGEIQRKRSDTLNKNLSKPIPQFSPNTTLGEMRKKTGKVSETDVRRAAARLK